MMAVFNDLVWLYRPSTVGWRFINLNHKNCSVSISNRTARIKQNWKDRSCVCNLNKRALWTLCNRTRKGRWKLFKPIERNAILTQDTSFKVFIMFFCLCTCHNQNWFLFVLKIKLAKVPGLWFSTADARFVYIRLTSDAHIKIFIKPNKYKVEEHWWYKIPKRFGLIRLS